LVLSRVRLIRVRLVFVNLNPINDTYTPNRISWYLDVIWAYFRRDVVICSFLAFFTSAPTTNFARKRVKTQCLTLFRATKNSRYRW